MAEDERHQIFGEGGERGRWFRRGHKQMFRLGDTVRIRSASIQCLKHY